MQIQDRVGQQFGNYRLMQLIGKGGYAEVYLAQHIRLTNLQHAIKVLTGTNLRDEQKEEFLLEARTVANLQRLSLHIVQILDFGIQDNSIPYIVMEYAREGTLRSLYPRNTKAPLERVVFYVKQIAEALQCAHDQIPPIVHRDIKPENMLLRSIDHVLLSDFGIAIAGKTGPLMPIKERGVIGTSSYIAPERLSGHTRRASDQYSLGIVVYEWLSGSLPFDGTDRDICYQHLVTKPPSLYPACPGMTKAIEEVVMRTLAKNPEDRYPTVQAFALDLEAAVVSAPQQQHQMPTISLMATLPIPPKPQQLKANLHHQNNSTTISSVGQPPLPLSPPSTLAATSVNSISRTLKDAFDLSPHFANHLRYSFFRNLGIVLNILSAAFLFYTSRYNIMVIIAGLFFSLLMLTLCIVAVEEKLAIFFGIMASFYWAGIGWAMGNFISSSLHLSGFIFSLFVSFVFLSVSVGLHIWYVLRKNL